MMNFNPKKLSMAMVAGCLAAFTASHAEDTDGWASEFVAGVTLNAGNTENAQGNLGFGTKNISGPNETIFGAGFNYGETESETTTENASAALQYKRALSDAQYGFGIASALYDDIALIDYRFVIGPGLGHRLINEDARKLNLELGVAWVAEDVAEVEDDYIALRVGQTFEQQLNENAKIWESIEWLPEFSDFGNYLLNATLGIDTKISDSLSLRVAASNRYDPEPGEGLDENDLQIIAGVVFKP